MITIAQTQAPPQPTPARVRRLQDAIRRIVIEHIKNHTRDRIRNQSAGAGGTPLQGYSVRPLFIRWPRKGMKAITKPVGGLKTRRGYFFQGGYKDYREKAGLIHNRFVFENTGDAWKDWKILSTGSGTTPATIGFSKPANAVAANAAIERRPLLFRIDKNELSMVDADVTSLINDLFFPTGAGIP